MREDMQLAYLKIFDDMRAQFFAYSDTEVGRLFRAMMAYAFDGEEPSFDGVERYAWPFLKQNIDQCAEKVEEKKRSGAKGGASRASNVKQRQATSSTLKQVEADASIYIHEYEQDQDHDQDHEYEQDHEKNPRARGGTSTSTSFSSTLSDHSQEKPNTRAAPGWNPIAGELSEEDVRRSREIVPGIEAVCRHVGMGFNEHDHQKVLDLLKTYDPDEIARSIAKAADQGKDKTNWAYITGILKNGGGKIGNGAKPHSSPQSGNARAAHTDTTNPFLRMLKEGVIED